jgi:transposase InsO family protein
MNINFNLNDAVAIDGAYATVVRACKAYTRFKVEDGTFRELRPSDAFQKVVKGELMPTTPREPTEADCVAAGPVASHLALPPGEAARRDKRVTILQQLRNEEGEGPYADGQLVTFAERIKKQWPGKLCLSRTTLRDWLALDAKGKIEGLAIERDNRLEIEVEDLIQVAIDTHFHAPAPLSGALIHRVIRTEVRRRSAEIGRLGPDAVPLTVPSLATVHRRIAEQDDRKRIAAQLGEHRANMTYGAFGAAEVELVDENGLNLGRPWLTVAIDRATRMIVGFCIGWTPPSTLSVMLTLRHMLADRGYVAELFGGFIKNDLFRCGLPSIIVVDNGKEFHSVALQETCRRLGITVQMAERLCAHLKGKVERFFRTLNMQVIHALPGTTLSTFDRKSDYRPKKAAKVTLLQLNVLLHKYLIDIYPHQWQCGIKNTPHAAWTKPKVRFVAREPRQQDEIYLLTCPVVTRKLHHYGVELFGLRFQHEALAEVRIAAKGNTDVEIRYDPVDLTQVYVFDTANRRVIPATCTDPDMHGQTFWQVQARNRADNERRKDLQDDSFFAREAEWHEALGLTQGLLPGSKERGKKVLARSLTLAGTPAEQLRHVPLALNDSSTFHGGKTQVQATHLLSDYSHYPDLDSDTNQDAEDDISLDEGAISVADTSDLDAFASKHNLNS